MNSVWILVIWDGAMPTVERYEDEHEAIESLKDVNAAFTAHLYQCNPDGMIAKVQGW